MKYFKIILLILLVGVIASCSKDDVTTSTTILSIAPTSGPKNSTVVLTGTNFSANAADNIVTLNGKACSVTIATTTSLSIIIPPGAGSGTISLTVDGATVQSPSFEYILTASVTTLAGTTVGFTDGAGTVAQFRFPKGVAIDGSGNVYVADIINHRIRKVSPTGEVTTFAGSTSGFADGTGTSAQFSQPTGVAVDASGNVYITDSDNNRIRKITPAGVVTTLAGSTVGFADGTGNEAQFNNPSGVAVDASANLYVVDYLNHKIRKVSPTGVVTTLAGSTQGFADGTGTNAQFQFPTGIAIDASGNIYVADRLNHKIRKISATGVVTSLAGSTAGFADGTGASAQFNLPVSITVDAAGDMYVADEGNNKIRKVTATGVVTTLAGSVQGFADGIGAEAQFYYPSGVALDALGNMYVADYSNHKIRKIVLD